MTKKNLLSHQKLTIKLAAVKLYNYRNSTKSGDLATHKMYGILP